MKEFDIEQELISQTLLDLKPDQSFQTKEVVGPKLKIVHKNHDMSGLKPSNMSFIKDLVAKHALKDKFQHVKVTAKTSTVNKIKNFATLYDPKSKAKKEEDGMKKI
jgi:hypothetical protein